MSAREDPKNGGGMELLAFPRLVPKITCGIVQNRSLFGNASNNQRTFLFLRDDDNLDGQVTTDESTSPTKSGRSKSRKEPTNSTMTKKIQKMKYKRAPCAPKRFKSGYMFFSEHQHKVIRDNSLNKKIRAADAAKMVSQAWKELSDGERSKWLEMGRVDRERYEKEKAAYKGPWKVPDVKDPNGPKKPMSAFLAFGNERRKVIAEANPALTGTEISSLLSKLWKECPAEVKQRYRDREAREREEFKKTRAEWERQKDQALVEAIMCDSSAAEESDSNEESHPRFFIPKEFAYMGPANANNLDMNELLSSFNQVTQSTEPAHASYFSCPVGWENLDITTSPTFPCTNRQDFHMISEGTLEEYTPNTVSGPSSSVPSTITVLPATRFDDLSWEEILQDDELFEDFPASQVPRVTSSTNHVPFMAANSMPQTSFTAPTSNLF